MQPPQSDVPPLVPNLFELLPLYAQIFLLIVSLVIVGVGASFVMRAARSAFGANVDDGIDERDARSDERPD